MKTTEKEKRAVKKISRRSFLGRAAGAAAGTMALAGTAASYSRVVGANDRIRIGQIGCSDRSAGLRRMLKASMKQDPNLELVSLCDIWSGNLNRAADDAAGLFGNRPKTYKYSEDLLAERDLDAVMVATGDHQHARVMAEVVRAGKDVYCEKPLANTLADAKLARDAVLETGQVAQMGSQWLSCPYQQKVREIIRSGRLGKITKIEQSWNYNGPRWYVPKDRDIAAIREEDTDWERWLLGRPWRPFDPRVYFEFRIFKDFSGGITDQWYSHGSCLAHFFLDTLIPDDTVANGGIFAWHDVRENPDTFQCLSTFQSKEVLYSYSSSYGNYHGDHTVIRGTEGTLYSPGGEGSPRWYFKPEMRSAWGSNVVFDRSSEGEPEAELVSVEGREGELPPINPDDDLSLHTDNWLECIRSRKKPNSSIETGFAHSVAVVMATRAYREGGKIYWDREREELVDSPPKSRRG
ncbi:MAG: Gfo/Idh/MocA family oxidoreductase [Candidatus Glassbacteria bacterium]|nr:Gfo/Idh/MocA family oxidoreductase [Candidatus Glassbacteria bacterium]